MACGLNPCFPAGFQSTPPARGATYYLLCKHRFRDISIHAPREGGDHGCCVIPQTHRHFNPRPPRGGRPVWVLRNTSRCTFQSTPPARGATAAVCDLYQNCGYFNPRPPRGGRLIASNQNSQPHDFNPRPPRGGRPLTTYCYAAWHNISIHAPREGGDHPCSPPSILKFSFQSTPPARGATVAPVKPSAHCGFQSTPPARGATIFECADIHHRDISIHAPREGGDDYL